MEFPFCIACARATRLVSSAHALPPVLLDCKPLLAAREPRALPAEPRAPCASHIAVQCTLLARSCTRGRCRSTRNGG
eukprot:38777-Rhodomonas_salina.1